MVPKILVFPGNLMLGGEYRSLVQVKEEIVTGEGILNSSNNLSDHLEGQTRVKTMRDE